MGEGDSRIAPTGEGKGQPRGIDSRGRGSSRLKSVVVSRWFVVGGEVCLRSLAGRRDGGVGGVGWGWTYATDWQYGVLPPHTSKASSLGGSSTARATQPREWIHALAHAKGALSASSPGSGAGMTGEKRGRSWGLRAYEVASVRSYFDPPETDYQLAQHERGER